MLYSHNPHPHPHPHHPAAQQHHHQQQHEQQRLLKKRQHAEQTAAKNPRAAAAAAQKMVEVEHAYLSNLYGKAAASMLSPPMGNVMPEWEQQRQRRTQAAAPTPPHQPQRQPQQQRRPIIHMVSHRPPYIHPLRRHRRRGCIHGMPAMRPSEREIVDRIDRRQMKMNGASNSSPTLYIRVSSLLSYLLNDERNITIPI